MSIRFARFVLALALTLTSSLTPQVFARSNDARRPARLVDALPIGSAARATAPSGRLMLPVFIVAGETDATAPRAMPLAAPGAIFLASQPITQVRLCNVDGGCAGLVTTTLATDAPLTLYAAGYGDNPEEYEGSLPVTWTVSSGANVTPVEGASTTLDGVTPGTVVVTATVIATPAIETAATFTVMLGALDHIRIRSAADGTGSEYGPATLTAGDIQPLYAAGYDADDNFIADQAATWTLNGGIGEITPTFSVSTTFSAITATTGSIQAEATPSLIDTTDTLTVEHGAADHLRVDLAASGTAGVGFGATITVEDALNNTVLDFTDAITLTSPNGGTPTPESVQPAAGVWGGTITLTAAGAARIVNAETGVVTGTATIDIDPGPATSLTIEPSSASVTAGQGITYTAIATDSFGNGLGDVTDQTEFTIAPESGGVFSGNAVTPTFAATWTVTGTLDSAIGSASLTVNSGTAYTLTVTPATAVISAGAQMSYTASAVDLYSNSLGDVTMATTFDIDPGSGGAFSGSAITPTLAGTFIVTGTHADSASDAAALTVTADDPTTLTLNPATSVISAGVRITYTANAFDSFGNPIGDVTAETSFSVAPNPGASFSSNSITPTLKGAYTVTGTHAGFGLNDTAALTVTSEEPFTVTLQPPTSVISAGVHITYTAIATDVFGNGIGDVTAASTFAVAPNPGASFSGSSITPTLKGAYTVTGTHTATGRFGTAALSVTPGPFARLAIENAPNGAGDPIGPTTITLYATLTLYGVDYDAFDNVIGANSSTWAASGVLNGRLSPISGFSTTLTPAPIVSGTGIITATSGVIGDTAGPITITAPELHIVKSASVPTATPGSSLQYSIYYTNTGSAAAQGVVVTETYPLSTTFAFAFPNPDSGNNVWSIGSLAPGESDVINVALFLAPEYPVGSTLTNTVRVGASMAETDIFTLTTPVSSTPNVTVTVMDSADPVRPGDVFIYTIKYRNGGTAPASGVRITETYPAGVSFVSAGPEPSSGNNVWVLDDPLGAQQSGEIFVTVRVNSPLPNGTVLNNVVTIDSSITDPFSDVELTTVQAPTIALTKSASTSTPSANSTLTYTLRYTNSGSTYASGVVVTDAVPANTAYQSCAPGGVCSHAAGTVTWNLGQVPAQTSGLLTMTVFVNNNLVNGTALVNTARISTTENVSSFVRITQTVASAPSLSLTKSDGVTGAAAGQTLTYVLPYANAGNAPAGGVVITDRIPVNTAFQTCVPACAQAGGLVTWTLGTLNASASGQVTVTSRVNSPLAAGVRSITNTARIQTTTPGDSPSNKFAQDADAITTVPALALGVSFDAMPPYPAKLVTYTVRYTNTSAMHTTGVVLSVTRSSFVTYLAGGSSAWQPAGGSVYTLPVGNLNAGAAGAATFVTQLPASFTATMGSFVNVFSSGDNGPGGLPPAKAVNTATTGLPDLVIESVSFTPAAIIPNQPFTAVVTVRNQGVGKACDAKAGCGGLSAVDAFRAGDPGYPPLSYPFTGYGDFFDYLPSVDAGAIAVAIFTNLTLTPTQSFTMYFKVDNWDCSIGSPCLPNGSVQHGKIPESDEFNNVFEVAVPKALTFRTFLPVVLKNH